MPTAKIKSGPAIIKANRLSAPFLYACVFMTLLTLPLFQRVTKLFPEPTLSGVTIRAPKAHFSIAGWFNGKYQQAVMNRFNERFGFRGFFIKTWNQTIYSLFGMIQGRRGTQIVIGRDNWLYEREYIRRYTRPGRLAQKDMLVWLDKVQKLQNKLAARGTAFVLVISPGKPQIYPERIPPQYTPAKNPATGKTDYDNFVKLLRKTDIHYVDGHALFLALKKNRPYPVFAPGGTHWNHYGVYFAVDAILDTARPILGRAVPTPVYTTTILRKAEGADRDLADLLNMWAPPTEGSTVPIRRPDPRWRAKPKPKLDILITGDSFSYIIIDAICNLGVAGKIDLLYYFKRHFDYPPGIHHPDHGKIPNHPFRPETINLTALLKNRQIVILEMNEIFIDHLGWGFVEAALKADSLPREK